MVNQNNEGENGNNNVFEESKDLDMTHLHLLRHENNEMSFYNRG